MMVALLWLALAPTRLGGSVDYTAIYGVSMEPKLHRGDVAVLSPQSTYRVGEVVGYHNEQLQRTVLHRIIGRDGDRYVFKGDNNASPDSYEPTRDELIGRLWVRVPVVGNVFGWLRVPSHAALLAGLATISLLLFGGAGAAVARRRPRRLPKPQLHFPSALAGLLGPALFAVLGFGLLEGAALRHSATHLVDEPGAYLQQGDYHYSAHAPQGDVYPSSGVTTGQAIFAALVHDVDLGFNYRFVSAQPHLVHGAGSLDLTLGSSLGWTRALPGVANARLVGDTVHMSRTIDLPSIESTLAQYLKDTGVSNDSFTLTLAPHVRVHGQVAGKLFTSRFDPTPLTFIVDQAALRLAHPVLGASFGQPAGDPLRPSTPGSMPRTVPSHLRLLMLSPRVTTVRRYALLGAIATLALTLLAAVALATGRTGDELDRARRRYGHLLVPVTKAPEGARVFVERIDGLAQIATNYATVILHLREDACDSFFAIGEGSVFCHQMPRD